MFNTNEMLGFSKDSRLLIINADDFGMCHSVNKATICSIRNGLATSCTLMVPCPWSLHGLHLLEQNQDIPFGVHLTVISEQPYYRWKPLLSNKEVPSLIDETGFFYSEKRIPELLNHLSLSELECEFRTQVETVIATGLKPTHLDSHCHIHIRRKDIFEMTSSLSKEYGIALRVGSREFIDGLRKQGYPTDDHSTLDSYRLETRDKPVLYPKLLRELPPGLSEWAIHPGIGDEELKSIMPDWEVRQADFDFFTSKEAREIVEEENINIISYRPLLDAWERIRY